ncbi:hypothetical protein K466DRAFT_622915 [Polyporus arcularius HHB13444]|uniref:Uncharacterized protein n=1 Tax=Polyporus arcularius HHB13444 TaxID=1314778 RepID=A0A5C3P8M9_9APHY|nr:hypothetical protein K466DRAFT_622915 [Polyporus arcularius HHB13444]
MCLHLRLHFEDLTRGALRLVFGHKLVDVWGELSPKVVAYLDSVNVKFTTIDGVRFVFGGEPAGPVTLWIGHAHTPERGCMALVKEFDITDVEIEFREFIFTRSAGPKFLEPVSSLEPTVGVRGALTPALGLRIASKDTPHVEGTGGFSFAEGGDSDEIFLVTAGHVVFPPDAAFNDNYAFLDSSTPRHDVLLLGTNTFNDFVDCCKRQIRKVESEVNPKNFVSAVQEKRTLQKLVRKQCEVIEACGKFCEEVMTKWADQGQRVVGHVDYAVVELDRSKFDKSAFRGNVIEFGTVPISTHELHTKIRPDLRTSAEDHSYDRLFKLRGHLTEQDMRHPNMLDKNGEECLTVVVKNGSGSGVTVGQATGIFSYVREYLADRTHRTSREWAILPNDYKRPLGAFSAAGDSGSVIADGRGRFGGLLTGAAGAVTDRSEFDITYATPFFWLWPRIKANGFSDAHLDLAAYIDIDPDAFMF